MAAPVAANQERMRVPVATGGERTGVPVAAGERVPRWTGTEIDPHHPWTVVHSGYTVLVTNPDGTLKGRGREGLYDFDTRILSGHRLRLDGRPLQYVAGAAVESDRWCGSLRLPRRGGSAGGARLPEDTFEVRLTRRLGRGMVERIEVVNHSMTAAETVLTLVLAADFVDIQELDQDHDHRGATRVAWNATARTLRFDHHARHGERRLHRGLRVRVVEATSAPAYDDGVLRFRLRLPPHGRWRVRLDYESLVDGRWRVPPGVDADGATARDRARDAWRRRRARLKTPHTVVEAAFEQAADDLFALRNWEYDPEPGAWLPSAGVPTYTGVFGRDGLTAAWQGALLGPEMMRGALAIIAETQAREDTAWRDAEPGKLIHEMRRGPLSDLDIIPQLAYYGTQTTSAMFVVVLSEAWHWTGDDELVRRYRDVALRTFEWADEYGDRDGDGFLEYLGRSSKGLKNHAWKDSDEAIRYADGRLVESPIATVEEQAYHFMAVERMAEMLLVMGEAERAERFLTRARSLRRAVEEAFWLDDEGFYAMALDADKRPVRSIGSNPGHALATGLVAPERAERMARRLFAPDLFSGWGVRTLSSEHPSYNPWAYHLGTIWPVENATFALGLKRYGLDEYAERLVAGQLAAAGCFRRRRLPEALGGQARGGAPTASDYPRSNSPQAWSASATVQLLQVMLGLYPFAPARVLALVRPRLPAWLPALTLSGVRVGDATVSLRFERRPDGTTDWEVLERDGTLLVTSAPPPQDVRRERRGWGDALTARLLRRAPGRRMRALRIALGMER